MEIKSSQIGDLVIEGKTKVVHSLTSDPSLVLILSKDQITAGDGVKKNVMKGKSILSTRTNGALYEFLNACHVPTHYVSRVNNTYSEWERAFVAKKCEMIPIEWVSRRVATGSFLKRHPNVKEGTRFSPPKLETFFKDDANHDPFWSVETLVGAELVVGGLLIEKKHVTMMFKLTRLVFELLERVWQSCDHSLIDLKIEFGVFEHKIIIADVIDNDSWRLWPQGNKALMLDKQVYRNLDIKEINEEAINKVKTNFEIVAQRTQQLFNGLLQPSTDPLDPLVVIFLGSPSDSEHAQKIERVLRDSYGIEDVRRVVTSAHKTTATTLQLVDDVIQSQKLKAIIAIAGLSNGLGPVISGNTPLPVINSPPNLNNDSLIMDLWSSLRMPSGLGVSTVLGAENTALAAAQIVGNTCPMVWSRIRAKQTLNEIKMLFI